MNRRSASTLTLTLTTLSSTVCFAQGPTEPSKETSRADVEQCVAEHDRARQLRLGEQWQDARTAMVNCTDERCPLAIAADCRSWLDELAKLMPTLIVVVEGEELGAPHAPPLHVELDGTSLELKDPPRPIESLPGAHRLRFQLPGQQPVEIGFSLEKGEKNHLVRLRLPASKASGAPAPAASPIPKRPVPASTYWLSAAAVVAFASSTAFLVSGLNEHADAREICAPNCDDDIHQSIQARLLLADVSAGAGLVLGGLAVYTYLQRPIVTTKAHASAPALNLNGHGLSLLWGGQF
jgi:hypothetical protein